MGSYDYTWDVIPAFNMDASYVRVSHKSGWYQTFRIDFTEMQHWVWADCAWTMLYDICLTMLNILVSTLIRQGVLK